MTSFGWCSRVCLFFMISALLSSFLISTRTVPSMGWEVLVPGLAGSFLTAFTMSLFTSTPGALISARACLIMSRSVRP